MEKTVLAVAKKFQPDLETLDGMERVVVMADVFGLLYSTPLALFGLVWLIGVTDLALVRQEWPVLLLLLLLACLFQRLRFFLFLETRDTLANAEGSLGAIVTWSGALLFGPSALWLAVLSAQAWVPLWHQRQAFSTRAGANHLRNLVLELTGAMLPGLVALTLYERWGGVFPLPGLGLDAVLPALYATLVQFLISLLVWTPYFVYTLTKIVAWTGRSTTMDVFVRLTAVGLAVPGLVSTFAILAAGLYVQNGLEVFLFFIAGLLLVSWLARQLSGAVERNQQRSRELAQLEQLGRAILKAPPDASTLPALLREHVPAMFPQCQVEIRRFPDETVLYYPDDWPRVPTRVWEWVRRAPQARFFLPQATLPWSNQPAERSLVVTPVLDTETAEPIGGIYVAPQRTAGGVASLLPAVQSLGAQISSALHSARVYDQTLAHQKVEQELALAGEIQARFLPDVLPEVAGWQLAVALEPARQTSGDFYDVIPLPNGRLGLLVADVADKGTGAALYMALSRTLIRTYAVEHHTRPDFALRVANNRILTDTQVDLFVTLFYGVLDPLSGTLTYCNAGHNPPYLLRAQNGGTVEKLSRTGIPLGIFKGQTWEHRTVQLAPGDVVVFYTDGVTEAQDSQEAFFGDQQLLTVAQAHLGDSAQAIREALLAEIHSFVGDASQFDDITLMVLVREA